MTLEQIKFDAATVPRKIRWQFPFKTIYKDLDGTFTGQTGGGWAISDVWPMNLWDGECVEDTAYAGYLCIPTVTIRTIWFYNIAPGNLKNTDITVLPYDSSILAEYTTADELSDYEACGGTFGTNPDTSRCSVIEYRGKKNPKKHWNAPFVTGHTYYMRWEHGVDFENVRI